MADLTILHDFLRRARQRTVAAVLLRQAVTAAGAGFAGIILLLFLGTQILDWYWVLILCAGTFFFGLYRTLRGVPSTYRLAQQVDRRLALADHLSTAYYFSNAESNGRGSGESRTEVLERAVGLCDGIPMRSAAPIRLPRSTYASAVLAVMAVGMFSVRYFARGSLDLRPPLVPAILDVLRPTWLVAGLRNQPPRRTQGMPPQAGLAVDPESTKGQDESVKTGEGRRLEPGGDDKVAEASSLLDKMRDAFREMMDKLGLTDEARELAEEVTEDGIPGEKKGREGGKEGDPSQETAAKDGTPRPDEEGNQEGPADQKSLNAQKRVSDKPGNDSSQSGEGSGIGDSDGEKAIREAEQLAAMGKISEILGKRQANLTGEVMVEVTSSKDQKLTTPYSATDAAHAESGGEIHRDEVPLIYREYVQQYFEHVRKQAPATRAPAPQ